MPEAEAKYLNPKHGDIVQWFLGGPPMVVVDVKKASHPSASMVMCHWFSTDGHFCHYEFQVRYLVAASQPPLLG